MRSSTLFSMGLLALSVSIGVVGCGDDDDDGNNNTTAGSAGKGGGTSTAGKGGASGSSSTAGKGGGNSTAGKGGKGGTDAGGDGGGGDSGSGPIGGDTSGGTGGAAGGADTGGQTGEGGGGGEVAATDVGVNGAKVLTDAAGMSLYVRDGDTVSTDTPDSKCANDCPGWPVFKVDVASVPAALDAGDFKSFNGSLGDQTAYKGHPLYYYALDMEPGQTKGDGLGPWHVVKIPFTP